jgi:hypothetical protein
VWLRNQVPEDSRSGFLAAWHSARHGGSLAKQGKVLTSFVQRRQVEDDLNRLAVAQSEAEFTQLARQIAAHGTVAVSALVANLDRGSARLLTALGVVATLLDRATVIDALERVLREPNHTDRERLAAMTLLERFLGETVDEESYASIQHPAALAQRSLQDVLAQSEQDPRVLGEFMQGMDNQPPELARRVVASLGALDDPRAVEALRCLAQDVRADVAADALDALGRRPTPDAASALRSVRPLLPDSQQARATRALRKLQVRGVPVPDLPPPAPAWRALVSPVDGLGRQSVWFIQPQAEQDTVRFLSVMLLEGVGLNSALANPAAPPDELPAPRPVGTMHQIGFADAPQRLILLEAPFDYGRSLLLRAADDNRAGDYVFPPELRLYGTWLWNSAARELPWPRKHPDLPESRSELLRETDRLLRHPAFQGWFAQSDALYNAAEQMAAGNAGDSWRLVQRVARQQFADPAEVMRYQVRLDAMAEWLERAQDPGAAQLAQATSDALGAMSAIEIPFILALVRRGLEIAIHNLRLGTSQESA